MLSKPKVKPFAEISLFEDKPLPFTPIPLDNHITVGFIDYSSNPAFHCIQQEFTEEARRELKSYKIFAISAGSYQGKAALSKLANQGCSLAISLLIQDRAPSEKQGPALQFVDHFLNDLYLYTSAETMLYGLDLKAKVSPGSDTFTFALKALDLPYARLILGNSRNTIDWDKLLCAPIMRGFARATARGLAHFFLSKRQSTLQ